MGYFGICLRLEDGHLICGKNIDVAISQLDHSQDPLNLIAQA